MRRSAGCGDGEGDAAKRSDAADHGPREATGSGTAGSLAAPMPIYEYKCPNGHLLEVFHGMNEPGPTACEVCGASPLQRVLHPVAVHYKGSGFYSTDYGKGGRKAAKDSGRRTRLRPDSGSDSDSGSSGSDSRLVGRPARRTPARRALAADSGDSRY